MNVNHPTRVVAATPVGAVEETIATYDVDAETYAERFSTVDFETYLAKFIEEIPTGTGVLDVGCGSGRDLAWLTGHGINGIGLDRSRAMLAIARGTAPRAGLVRGDLRRLPFADRTFGGAWHCASLLHLAPADALIAVAEVQRVLVQGGILFLSVASGQGAEWRDAAAGRRWFHYYDEAELDRIVMGLGMEVVSSTTESGVAHGRWVNVLARKRA